MRFVEVCSYILVWNVFSVPPGQADHHILEINADTIIIIVLNISEYPNIPAHILTVGSKEQQFTN